MLLFKKQKTMEKNEKNIEFLIEEHIRVIKSLTHGDKATIAKISKYVIESLKNGGTIFWCGNGGSAADSQHLAAELLGRFKRERRPLASVALTTDTSALTAIGNDYGFEEIFGRQLEGLAKTSDLLIAISTSGNSENIIFAVQKAKQMGIKTICLLGSEGGKLAGIADFSLIVPSNETARIQEAHILIGHIICDLVEQEFY